MAVNPPLTAVQKRAFEHDAELSISEQELVRRIDSRVHPYDETYSGSGHHYFSVALSAVRCINRALEAARVDAPDAILDMPCGYGRVLRALVARFPHAAVSACDLHPGMVRFCARRFAADGVLSAETFDSVKFGRPFDLIWCGSLVTHLDARQTLSLIDLFARSARNGALIVFTTHGESVLDRIDGTANYNLAAEGLQMLIRTYEQSGYGYANYPGEDGYGISVISPEWVNDHVVARGDLSVVYFAERDWDEHQDVFGLLKA